MPYDLRLDMGPSRFAIQEAIKQLCVEQDSASVEEIAERIRCSRRTVERHLPDLIKAGLVHKPPEQTSRKLGFRYKCGGKPNANAG